jgi:hypothetical protein
MGAARVRFGVLSRLAEFQVQNNVCDELSVYEREVRTREGKRRMRDQWDRWHDGTNDESEERKG